MLGLIPAYRELTPSEPTEKPESSAHPRVQGACCDIPITIETHEGSSPRAGSLHFLSRHYASRQPEKYSVPRIEMSI